ncbi:hypothetical protein BC939DRAFT_467085 [Gamsiella multidivaricata]|uniref:uncharacterized protein n=1 Tax=Gamsiella multidivaricata TaxID=101098 RepID=UPI00221E5423|nr:uncharacterized protein BC939DRAFT_467085 [Gamsiella multidivaricata]KAI7817059.1 hypothetical protein BC939DRAFT_467085 [Gamsiella multidivaricata]
MSSSPPRASRRESISSRLFNSRSPTSGLKSMDKDRNKTSTSSTTPSVVIPPPASSRPNPSQKYLEIDLRYTDVSSMGLALLRTNTIGQAKKVVVRTRDGENEECGDDEDRAEITRLAAKFGEKDETEEKTRRNGKGRTVAGISRSTQGPSTSVLFSGAYINTFATASSFQSPLSVTQQGSGSRSSSSQQPQPPTRSSTFMKLKGAFKKF